MTLILDRWEYLLSCSCCIYAVRLKCNLLLLPLISLTNLMGGLFDDESYEEKNKKKKKSEITQEVEGNLNEELMH